MFFCLCLTPAGVAADDGGFASKKSINLHLYLGTWYEVARTPNSFEDNTIQRNGKRYGACFNVTATYSLQAYRGIGVVNRCTREADDKSTIIDMARGSAVAKDTPKNRKLQVAFGGGLAESFQRLVFLGRANYWIYCTGQPRPEKQYRWAVVSGADRDFIFVLARRSKPTKRTWRAIQHCLAKERLPAEKLIYR